MGKYNWDLTRVAKCLHKKGEPNIYLDMENLIYSKHTGKKTVQVWTGRIDDDCIDGWACVHRENEDEITIANYFKEKELDLKQD